MKIPHLTVQEAAQSLGKPSKKSLEIFPSMGWDQADIILTFGKNIVKKKLCLKCISSYF